MGGKITDGIHEPVRIFSHMLKIRRIKIPEFQVLLQLPEILLPGLTGILRKREQGIDIFQDLTV